MRIPEAGGKKNRTISGYYSDLEALTAQAEKYFLAGTYVTINPCNPALLARRSNRTIDWADTTTSDADVTSRRWLPIDLDPIRPSKISSTNVEHEAALNLARTIRDDLSKLHGWPEPILADSGNGAHLLYRLDMPNDAAARDLLQRTLQALDYLYSDDRVGVDITCFNASRIMKLYGTVSRKGDDTTDRPHRLARILEPADAAPDRFKIVTVEQLQALAACLPEEPKPARGRR